MTGWGPPERGHYERARRTPCASLFFAAAAVVVFLWPGLSAHLQYDRAAIAAGQVWRLVSGHWAHYSLDHVFWDVVAFTALGVACERRSRAHFLVCLVASTLSISVSVWLMLPEIRVYRGLSGIDSALFTFLAASMWNDGCRSERPGLRMIAMACVGAFLLKVVFELVTGNTVFVKGMDPRAIGVPLAHMVGAGCGLVVGARSRLVLRSSRTPQWISSTT